MAAIVFLVVVALVFAVVWINLARNPGPRAKLGPDGTNVREPETFVVHHEGKGQGIDIANTALKERTEHLRQDLPGEAHKLKTPVPGRDLIRMDAPPSDVSKYGADKVAPGTETKEKVLTEGPVGSRTETPEEPGSPFAKGRRVTDIYRDVELAAEPLPNVFLGQKRHVGPGDTDGEGGDDYPDEGGYDVPELTDDVPDLPEGDMPTASVQWGRVLEFRHPGNPAFEYRFEPDEATQAVEFSPDPSWEHEATDKLTWASTHAEPPLVDLQEDRIVAMVRNPRSLYVYWERSGHGDENLRNMLGAQWDQSQPVLRVFDVTSGAYPGQAGGHSFSITVGDHDDHWFVNEGILPGHRYVVSYERRTAGGQLYLISHSAPISTPHDGPATPDLLYDRYGQRLGPSSVSIWR